MMAVIACVCASIVTILLGKPFFTSDARGGRISKQFTTNTLCNVGRKSAGGKNVGCKLVNETVVRNTLPYCLHEGEGYDAGGS